MRSEATNANTDASPKLRPSQHRGCREHKALARRDSRAASGNADREFSSFTGTPTSPSQVTQLRCMASQTETAPYAIWFQMAGLCRKAFSHRVKLHKQCKHVASSRLSRALHNRQSKTIARFVQKGCRGLLPEIERRLQAKAQWLATACDFKGAKPATTMQDLAYMCLPCSVA